MVSSAPGFNRQPLVINGFSVQIVEALPLADIAKNPLAGSWTALQTFPADNAAAGLPVPDKIVNNFVSARYLPLKCR